jgi:hypothetical protein
MLQNRLKTQAVVSRPASWIDIRKQGLAMYIKYNLPHEAHAKNLKNFALPLKLRMDTEGRECPKRLFVPQLGSGSGRSLPEAVANRQGGSRIHLREE